MTRYLPFKVQKHEIFVLWFFFHESTPYSPLVHTVELLHSLTTIQSHWSSGSTICFPPREAVVRVPGDAPTLLELGFYC
jgi:hypothetical protein